MILRHKQLVALLQQAPQSFPDPKFELEQYPTPPGLAADILYSIEATYGAFGGGKRVCDLGCGPGMLSIGAAALGASSVTSVDIDADALDIAREAAEEIFGPDRGGIDFVLADVLAGWGQGQRADGGDGAGGGGGGGGALAGPPPHGPWRRTAEGMGGLGCEEEGAAPPGAAGAGEGAAAVRTAGSGVGVGVGVGEGGVTPAPLAPKSPFPPFAPFDTVVMNPPFGTRRAGADVGFVRAALALADPQGGAVYSLHKSSTRAHMVRVAESLGAGLGLVAELRFAIPATYAFHRSASVDVAVDLLRFVRGPAGQALAAAHGSIPAYVPAAEAGAGAADGAAGGGATGGRGGGGRGRRGR